MMCQDHLKWRKGGKDGNKNCEIQIMHGKEKYSH